MPSTSSPRSRCFTRSGWALLALLVAACDGSGFESASPTAPPFDRNLPYGPSNYNFFGEGTALAITGPGCPADAPGVGVTEPGHSWRVEISGNAFYLSEDLQRQDDVSWYEGELQGLAFEGTWLGPPGAFPPEAGNALEASIHGAFAEDLNSFEAEETVISRPSGQECRWVYRFRAWRR